MNISNYLLKKGVIPDMVIRWRIRNLLTMRLADERKKSQQLQKEHLMQIIDELKHSAIAIDTKVANEQHYEVPTEFFKFVMGNNMKYSSCYWNETTKNLDDAEQLALQITCQHADIKNEMDILELGCGWGSLTLFIASKYPQTKIIGVSNSTTQKKYIDACCAERGLKNVEIITEDMNTFSIDKKFDRVVSVEMFEHMRNYELLLKKVSDYLKPEGKLFVHIFTHNEFTYYFNVKDETDWMSKYFFTGGIMPGDNLLSYFNKHMHIIKHWNWDGTHYEKTANTWLQNMDRHKNEIMPILEETYGPEQKMMWWVYWRIFFMACAELWGYKKGREWYVSHYLFEKVNR